jgi:hypothetical protein
MVVTALLYIKSIACFHRSFIMLKIRRPPTYVLNHHACHDSALEPFMKLPAKFISGDL